MNPQMAAKPSDLPNWTVSTLTINVLVRLEQRRRSQGNHDGNAGEEALTMKRALIVFALLPLLAGCGQRQRRQFVHRASNGDYRSCSKRDQSSGVDNLPPFKVPSALPFIPRSNSTEKILSPSTTGIISMHGSPPESTRSLPMANQLRN